MRNEESKPDDRADVGEQQSGQAAQDDADERGPAYGEPSTDTDADGGLSQNPLTEP